VIEVALPTLGAAFARLGLAAAGAAAAGVAIGRASAGLPEFLVLAAGGATMLVAFVGLAHVLGVREVAQVAARLARRVRRGNAN
jgi:hypothetical protein